MRFAVIRDKIQEMMSEQHRQSTDVGNTLKQFRPVTQASSETLSASSDSDKCVEVRSTAAKRKHRRGRHRRRQNKPYSRMTVEEKKRCDAKAAQREAELVGKPSAPWNTTQFIMEDRESTEVKLPSPRGSRTMSIESSLSDEEYYDSPEDEIFEHGLCLEQDFESTYQQVASERLQGLEKNELVDECLHLEEERDLCKKELDGMKCQVNKLSTENTKLKDEMDQLRMQIAGSNGSVVSECCEK